MRFKAITQPAQTSLATRWAAFVLEGAEPGIFPIVPVATWLKAFVAINPKIRGNGMPSADCMDRVASWVDDQLHGPAPLHGTCSCCGTSF